MYLPAPTCEGGTSGVAGEVMNECEKSQSLYVVVGATASVGASATRIFCACGGGVRSSGSASPGARAGRTQRW